MSDADAYRYPAGDDVYAVEPSDAQCRVLIRSLWHWSRAYETDATTTVAEIVNDMVQSQIDGFGMSLDEWREVHRVLGTTAA